MLPADKRRHAASAQNILELRRPFLGRSAETDSGTGIFCALAACLRLSAVPGGAIFMLPADSSSERWNWFLPRLGSAGVPPPH